MMNISRIVTLLIFGLSFSINLLGQNVTDSVDIINKLDSVANDNQNTDTSKKRIKYTGYRHLRVGVDAARLVNNFIQSKHTGAEVQLDYRDAEKRYWVIEAGFARGRVAYDFLNYNTNTGFMRVGLDNCLIGMRSQNDFDIAYIGARYGFALGRMSDATYSFSSPFGGIFEGTYPGSSFFLHWGEVTAGMKLEVYKNIFIGWNARVKFAFNTKQFEGLAPNYIAGYGNAINSTNVDINFYVSYSLHKWKTTKAVN